LEKNGIAMMRKTNNFAFVDGQNVNLSTLAMGWRMDFRKLRVYLTDKYGVVKAYYFIGYVKGYERLYKTLESYGYELVYKRTSLDGQGRIKGNVDAELVLQAMIDFNDYEQAVLISSDGDFTCLVEYLQGRNKFYRLLAASRGGCARALRRAAGSKIDYIDFLRGKLEYT
jgi:uncharacterized LabA/DUF88 family protein